MKQKLVYYAVLMVAGLIWGAVFPITKIAVSSGHKPFGIIVWQMVIGITLSLTMILLRGQRLPSLRAHWRLFLGVSLLGTLAPNVFSYTASAHLPAGIISIIIALVPVFAMAIALLLGFEKPALIRLIGAGCGVGAILIMVGPKASLPEGTQVFYVVMAVAAPLLYGAEANFLTWIGNRGLGAFQIMLGSMVFGLVLAIPLALVSGQIFSPFRPWHGPEIAIVAGASMNWVAYVAYVWLIGRAGPVFSAQVAYLVTGWGVVISMVFLGETYSLWIWAAFALMLIGVGLVRPRDS